MYGLTLGASAPIFFGLFDLAVGRALMPVIEASSVVVTR